MRRWAVLAASILMQTCLGGVYAWSVFTPPLRAAHGVTAGQAGLVFGVTIAVFTVTMVFAGRWQESRGPRLVAGAGAALFGAGYLVASVSGGWFPLILAGIGVLAGLGTGCGYVCALATCVKWFPKHKGLITGVAVTGFGGGAILLSHIVDSLLGCGLDVLEIFRWIGASYGLVILASAMVLRVPAGAGPAASRALPGFRDLFASREFRSLWAGMFTGTFGGLLVVGNLKPIGMAAALSSDSATLGVQVFAAGNAAGRLVWGWIYDRIGRIAIPVSLLALLASVAALGAAASPAVFVCLSGVTGFSFGACFVLYAAQVAQIYGNDRLGSVYPVVFLAYGFSGLTGPAIGGWIYDLTRSYAYAITMAASLLGLGAVWTWLSARPGRSSAVPD